MEGLEREFHEAMIGIYVSAKEQCGYSARRFRHRVSELGGLEAARRPIHSAQPSGGFGALWEHGRPDLTVEAHVLQSRFKSLFGAADLKAATDRLHQYGYAP